MSPSTEAGLTEKAAVIQKLVVLLPRVVILLKRSHHIQLTSRETGDSRNQMDEKDSQITHHTIPTRVRNPRNARKLGIRQRHDCRDLLQDFPAELSSPLLPDGNAGCQ